MINQVKVVCSYFNDDSDDADLRKDTKSTNRIHSNTFFDSKRSTLSSKDVIHRSEKKPESKHRESKSKTKSGKEREKKKVGPDDPKRRDASC